MTNMTREQAAEQLQLGRKIRHEYFSDNEHLELNPKKGLITEDGYNFEDQFWRQDFFATGWSTVQES